MPSDTFPEFATRNRSAVMTLSGEVTAMPSALLVEISEAVSRSTSCIVVSAGLLQSTNSNFTSGSCIIDSLVVTQFQGSQTNCSSKCDLRTTQADEARGLNSSTRSVAICTP